MEKNANNELKEFYEYADEAEKFSEDEPYHSQNMSVNELKTQTADRPYYILLQKKDEYINEDLYIYVDRHDYLLYKRPIWREWRNEYNANRCIIIKNGKRVRCMGDCKTCNQSKSGKAISLDKNCNNRKIEPLADEKNAEELAFEKAAINMLWDKIREHATPTQYIKILKHYKDDMTLEQIANEYGVSKQAISKSELEFFRSLAKYFSDEDKEFIIKNIRR